MEPLLAPYRMNGPVCSAFDRLRDEVLEELASSREENLGENGWAYQRDLSPLIHPDYTDPDKRRAVVVGIVDADECDLAVETAGPFPMAVEGEDGSALIINSEQELLAHFGRLYGERVTTIRPMPFAPGSPEDEDE